MPTKTKTKTVAQGRKRNYRREYDQYHAKAEQKKRRAGRNAARAKMAAAGRVKKGDGKEVDHKNGNARQNGRSNLRVISATANRRAGALKRHRKS